jgi:hypothetical protein
MHVKPEVLYLECNKDGGGGLKRCNEKEKQGGRPLEG